METDGMSNSVPGISPRTSNTAPGRHGDRRDVQLGAWDFPADLKYRPGEAWRPTGCPTRCLGFPRGPQIPPRGGMETDGMSNSVPGISPRTSNTAPGRHGDRRDVQ